MITERDIKVLKHIEKYGFITIQQTKDMFYNTASGYDMARRRLNKLVASNYLKVSRNTDTNEKIFYEGNYKEIKLHRMLLMNYYSKLVNNKVKIIHFEKEKYWNHGEIKSDGFCIFEFGDYLFYQLIEVCVSNNDQNLNKYEKIYDSNEIQNTCKSIADKSEVMFPRLIVIDKVKHKKPIELPRIDTVVLNFELSDVGKVFA